MFVLLGGCLALSALSLFLSPFMSSHQLVHPANACHRLCQAAAASLEPKSGLPLGWQTLGDTWAIVFPLSCALRNWVGGRVTGTCTRHRDRGERHAQAAAYPSTPPLPL